MPDLYQYLDYRRYLRDFYGAKKKSHSFFSYRYMGAKLDLDPSFLVKVIQGDKHLANKALARVCEFLDLDEKEQEYFQYLVSFNKAKKNSDIKIFYGKLSSLRQPRVKSLDKKQFEFFNAWHNVAIYELLRMAPFKGNFSTLAKKINPPITAAQAKAAIRLMLDLNLIEKREDKSYRVVEDLVSTGEKWQSLAIHQFQLSVMDLAKNALDRIPKKDRDISTVTVGVSRETFERMRERVQALRRELLQMSKEDENPETVMQANFQLFPITQWEKEKK